MSVPYSALVDASTYALLALSKYPYIPVTLAKSAVLQAECYHGVNWPNYRKNFPLATARPDTYPQWTYDKIKRIFLPIHKPLLTDELRARAALTVAKCRALGEIVYEISVCRYALWRGPLLQETVFATKLREAKVGAGPYVQQYADIAQLSLADAADEILFKAELDEAYLLWTEGIRMKYAKELLEAVDLDEVKLLLKRFHREAYKQREF